MVSVCMATYNGDLFIQKQLKSIIKQLSKEDEIIISDDGSTDRTIELIKAFNDDRIKIFENKNSQGPIGNFENALRKASGDIIFLADQDDEWMNDKIKKHLHHHVLADLVISDAVVEDEFNKVIFPSFFKQRKSRPGFWNNILKNSYIGCCMSFNKKILNLATPFPKNIHMHDWWIGLVAELKGKTYFLDEPLMYYKRHSNNASGTLTKSLPFSQQLKNRKELIKAAFHLLSENANK